ncbi:hypothetical protein [Sandaracinus amylolyticus]|uniref:hypothetical protein n=1 Tax=Sandaracinus amylolyticus TaxID=927083 RepID=UPI001F3C97E3|nr:hypothetical protein [Sandaracinus amylolyticus]UJR78526.1 Type I restriction endonuclease subunit S [Sandaracinus amylolyticus]
MSEELPEGWRARPLSEIADIEAGLTKNGALRARSRKIVPLVSVAAVQSRRIDVGELSTIGLLEADRDRGTLAPGDVLVVEGNGSLAHLGRAAMWNNEVPDARLQNHILRVRAHACDSAWLLEWLASPDGRAAIREQAVSATGLYTLSKAKLGALSVPIAPHEQERSIVARLGALRARSRRAKDALDAVPALLDRLRQSILAAAFRGDLTADWREQNPAVEPASELLKRIRLERRRRWEEAELAKMLAKGKPPKDALWKSKYVEPEPVDDGELPELPEGWSWATGTQLFEFVTSGSRGWAEYYSAEGAAFLRVGNTRRDDIRLDLSELQRVQTPTNVEGERTRVRQGDIVVSITADLGRVGYVQEQIGPAYVSQHLALIRLCLPELAEYIALWLSSPLGQHLLKLRDRGMTKAGLGLDDVRSVPIPLAPRAEIAAVVARAASQVRGRFQMVESTTAVARSQILALDRVTLSAAFRGGLS